MATDTNVSALALIFDIGDVARLKVDIKVDDVLTDPTDLQVQVKEPDRTITTKTLLLDPGDVIKDAVGQFHYDFTVTQTGKHVYRWLASGTAVGAEERAFSVKESEFD